MADPYSKDITIRFGDTKEIFFRVRERVYDAALDAWIAGDYRDLTNVVVTAQIRGDYDDANPLVSFTATLGDQTDLVLGRGAVSLRLTPAQTAGLNRSLAKGVWDCQFTYPSGDVYTYIEGNVTFKKDVTR